MSANKTPSEAISVDLYKAARDWLIECYPDEEDEIREASDARIFKAVSRDYDGGWFQFAIDAEPVYIPR